MAGGSAQADEVLLGLAQHHDGIGHLLDSIFSFFERRTDLYHVMQGERDKMGFPPHKAEQMVRDAFKKNQHKYLSRAQPGLVSQYAEWPPKGRDPDSDKQNAPRVTSDIPKEASNASKSGSVASKGAAKAPAKQDDSKAPASSETSGAIKEGSGYADGKQAQEADRVARQHGKMSTWNGAETDKYSWSQSVSDITFEMDLPEKAKARDIDVNVSRDNDLTIKVRGEVVLDGTLDGTVIPGETVWTLERGERLNVTLDKKTHTWWKSLLVGHQEIDTSQVESTKKIEEYDGETQGTIRKIMFDQNQKIKGEATSDQILTANVMKEAWEQPDSPFAGTPFDPSMLNLQGQVSEEFLKKAQKAKLEQAIRAKQEAKQAEGGASSSSGP